MSSIGPDKSLAANGSPLAKPGSTVYRNRLRGHNVPHIPDIQYRGNLQDTEELKNRIPPQVEYNP